jgi:hypothetical protein
VIIKIYIQFKDNLDEITSPADPALEPFLACSLFPTGILMSLRFLAYPETHG